MKRFIVSAIFAITAAQAVRIQNTSQIQSETAMESLATVDADFGMPSFDSIKNAASSAKNKASGIASSVINAVKGKFGSVTNVVGKLKDQVQAKAAEQGIDLDQVVKDRVGDVGDLETIMTDAVTNRTGVFKNIRNADGTLNLDKFVDAVETQANSMKEKAEAMKEEAEDKIEDLDPEAIVRDVADKAGVDESIVDAGITVADNELLQEILMENPDLALAVANGEMSADDAIQQALVTKAKEDPARVIDEVMKNQDAIIDNLDVDDETKATLKEISSAAADATKENIDDVADVAQEAKKKKEAGDLDDILHDLEDIEAEQDDAEALIKDLSDNVDGDAAKEISDAKAAAQAEKNMADALKDVKNAETVEEVEEAQKKIENEIEKMDEQGVDPAMAQQAVDDAIEEAK